MVTPPMGHFKNVFGFIFTSTRLIKTKLGIMIDKQALTLI